MSIEEFIISVYCLIAEKYAVAVCGHRLRTRGTPPGLSDCEAITIFIVGEYLGLGSDKHIWRYFKAHWQSWFPRLGCRTSFTRQSANLCNVQKAIQESISAAHCHHKDLFLFDGFPIPVCHIRRYKRRRVFGESGGVGYCAAKDEYYFGFKGHILITQCGAVKTCVVASAPIDERDMLPEIAEAIVGDIIADKGLIRPELTQMLARKAVNLHTPLRKNMNDPRPKPFVNQLMDIRRKVETVISQLVDRFKIQTIKAKDTWHLLAKINRKILAHTVCFAINAKRNPLEPLQFDKIIAI